MARVTSLLSATGCSHCALLHPSHTGCTSYSICLLLFLPSLVILHCSYEWNETLVNMLLLLYFTYIIHGYKQTRHCNDEATACLKSPQRLAVQLVYVDLCLCCRHILYKSSPSVALHVPTRHNILLLLFHSCFITNQGPSVSVLHWICMKTSWDPGHLLDPWFNVAMLLYALLMFCLFVMYVVPFISNCRNFTKSYVM